MAENQINATVGLDTSELRYGVSAALGDLSKLNNGVGSLARQLQRQQHALTDSTDSLIQHRIATANMTDAQRVILADAHAWNRTLAQITASEQAAIQAENQRKQSIDRLLGSLTNQVSALGKTNAQLQLNELRTLGASNAQIKQAESAQNLIAAHERLNRVASGGMSHLLGVGATLGMVGGASGLLDVLDAWTGLSNRLKLVHDNSQDVVAAQEGILNVAKTTGSRLGEVGAIYQRFAQNQRTLGLSTQEIINLTDTVSKSMSLSGVSAESGAAALNQFGQALASGVLRGEEFNSIAEQAPALLQTLAKGLDVNIGQLRKMAHEGRLTTDVVVGALQKMQQSVNDDFNKTAISISGSFEIFKTYLTEFIGKSGEGVNAANMINHAILFAAKNIDLLAIGLGGLLTVKLASWTVMGAAGLAQNVAAMIALRHAAAASAVSNGANILSISKTGTAASIAAMQVTGLSGALNVLSVSARTSAASASLWYDKLGLMSGATGPAIVGVAALTASMTALFSAIEVKQGKSGDNWISNLANDIADALDLIDTRTESIGTKLFDRWQNQNQLVRDFVGVLNPIAKKFWDWVAPLEKANNVLEKQKQLLSEVEVRLGYQSAVSQIDEAGGVVAFQANRLGLEDLKKSLGETVVRYREQIFELGKSKDELALLRLETEKQIILKKQQAAFEKEFSDQANKDELVAQAMAKFAAELDRDFQAVTSAMGELAQKTQEAKLAEEAKTAALKAATEQQERQNRINQTLSDMRDELERVGKSAKEIKLMDLQKAGATAAQLAQAKSLLDLQELRERQFAEAGNGIASAAKSFESAVEVEKSYISAQAELLRQQADAYNKQEELKREITHAEHVNRQGGLTNAQWRDFSLKKYGHEWFAQTDEYKRVAMRNEIKGVEQLVQSAVELAGQTKPISSNAINNVASEEIFSRAVNQFQAAIDKFSQNWHPGDQNQSLQKVSLDLRLPDGKTLTSILFAEPLFINKLNGLNINNMYGQIAKHAMSLS